MTLKTHFETGIVLSLLLGGMAIQKIDAMSITAGSKITVLSAILVGVTAGSVYPDIDFDKSNLNANDVDLQWESKFDHRGVIHTLVNVVGVSLPFFLLFRILTKVTSLDLTWIFTLGLSMAVGNTWHMMLDSLTPKGIMWLYPVTVYRFRIPIIRNYTTERIFRILVTGVMLYAATQLWVTNLY